MHVLIIIFFINTTNQEYLVPDLDGTTYPCWQRDCQGAGAFLADGHTLCISSYLILRSS